MDKFPKILKELVGKVAQSTRGAGNSVASGMSAILGLGVLGVGAYGISDQRYEYADDLIKVVGGKVERNDGQYRTTQPLANMYSGVTSIDGIGRGYGQMIIPSDGTTPYFYYYD